LCYWSRPSICFLIKRYFLCSRTRRGFIQLYNLRIRFYRIFRLHFNGSSWSYLRTVTYLVKIVIGNLNYPTLNRWGLNTFWPRLWFSDVNYSSTLHQDSIFEKLIKTYITYGLLLTKPFFLNSYWFVSRSRNVRLAYNSTITQSFRWSKYVSKSLNIGSVHRFRNSIIDLFFMKVSILRFDKWLILNFYWLRPYRKKKNVIATRKIKKKFIDLQQTSNSSIKTNLTMVTKLKFFIGKGLTKSLNFNTDYSF